MDLDAVIAEVAAAVGLAEGQSGVRDVLRAVAAREPAAVRVLSQAAELPVPIVAALCNELRRRGVIDPGRPVRLTAASRALLAPVHPELTGHCPACAGSGLAIPAELAGLADELAATADGAPAARLELDQTHCTVATKIHRVLRMHQAGALAGRAIILLGDDDLVSVAIAKFAARLGPAAALRRLAVVDADPEVLGWAASQVAGSGLAAEFIEHDLREPLPDQLTARFEVACTDPPYTVTGAELFLSRAVSALIPEPGQHVFFSFGARRPGQTVATQRMIAEMGLAIRSLAPGFNSYLGAGILAGTSHLYHLRSTEDTRPLVPGRYAGPLYTADYRAAALRPYRCAGCRAVHQVGPGGTWDRIGALQAAGCPQCGGTTFRPMALQPASWPGRQPAWPPMTGPAGAGYLIRAAGAADLDAIVGFEIDIAVVSFGDEAITDPALHRKRVSGALGKPGEVTLVAVASGAGPAGPGEVAGWAWLSARTNSLTGERYGNFRSLAAADIPDRGLIGELLLAAVVAAADEAGLRQLTGKVHAANLGMRMLYRKFGFEAAHLTMERRVPARQDDPPS